MKRISIILAIAGLILMSCSDSEDAAFDPGITNSAFSFRPMSGGAVMHYMLPRDPDVTGIRVRYHDAYGTSIIRTASNTCDSILLIGFNEAVSNVPAKVTLLHRDDSESQPIDVTFSTNDSGPVAFLKNADVVSNWEGFTVKYETPADTKGMVHVFYLGTDPLTGQPDTILVNSFNIAETEEQEKVNFKIKQDVKQPVVVLRVEDYRGHVVGEKTYTGIECLESEKLSPDKFSFYCDNAITNEYYMIGTEYLFDGDIKGIAVFTETNCAYKFCAFGAGPNAAGDNAHPMYMDMKRNYVTGSVRLYNALSCSYRSWNWSVISGTGNYQENMEPCNVELYGAVDDGDDTALASKDMEALTWVKIGSFKQDRDLPASSRWCPTAYGPDGTQLSSLEQMEEADPEYMEIIVPADGQDGGYRYLKMIIRETFNLTRSMSLIYQNTNHCVTLGELEIYTKKN